MMSMLNLTGDVGTLASAGESGLLLGCILFCGVLTVVILVGVGMLIRAFIKMYREAIESNQTLATSIDNLSDSNASLKEYLTTNTEAIKKQLEQMGGTLNKSESILKQHGERLDDHDKKIGVLEHKVAKK